YFQAYKQSPEAFLNIHILYVKITINGVSTIALVDTGATSSLLSLSFSKTAHLERSVDTRQPVRVRGIGGTEPTTGTIWICFFVINDTDFDTKLWVWERKTYDVLIGLDFLRRHKCTIDLIRNRLIFNDQMHVSFLSEAEIDDWEAGRE
ncbi:hypothetical protein PENTCL1PPCAC_28204, partial [Pristionchus entomophagus]